jgi:hypothetical protein
VCAPNRATLDWFRISIQQAELDDLAEHLVRTGWPAELPGAGWERGVPVGYLKALAEYWHTPYDRRVHEAELNTRPQFTTTILRQRVRFIQVRSPRENAVPLLTLKSAPPP